MKSVSTRTKRVKAGTSKAAAKIENKLKTKRGNPAWAPGRSGNPGGRPKRKAPAKKSAQIGVRAQRVFIEETRKPTRKTDLALLRADLRDLFDENGRWRKLADLPKHIRDTLKWVDVDRDGRIRGFEFKDKNEAIGRLLEP